LALVLCAAICSGVAPAADKDWVIHAGTLLDGVSEIPRRHVTIRVHADEIVAVEDGFVAALPPAELIDLATATVMPGCIDCHVHVGALLPSRENATEYWLTHNDSDRAFDAALFARGRSAKELWKYLGATFSQRRLRIGRMHDRRVVCLKNGDASGLQHGKCGPDESRRFG
jgi:predicted amidohydrolase YtcJ